MEPTSQNSLVQSRREAIVAMVIWLVTMVYSVGVSYWYGYGRDPQTLTFVLGIPDWVFWGVFVPWLVCCGLSWWFAYRFMGDEDWDRLEVNRENDDDA